MSTTNKAETELLRRVHMDKHFVEIGDWPDAPEALELRTPGKENEEYFGRISLVLTPQAAIELGEALVAAGNERLR